MVGVSGLVVVFVVSVTVTVIVVLTGLGAWIVIVGGLDMAGMFWGLVMFCSTGKLTWRSQLVRHCWKVLVIMFQYVEPNSSMVLLSGPMASWKNWELNICPFPLFWISCSKVE